MASYDVLGNIAVVKKKTSKKIISKLLKNPNIKTIVEKSERVKGRLRTMKTKHLAGERNLIAKIKENSCVFVFNIESCYFSSRLSNERKEIANTIKKNQRVLVMFSGIGVYPIVIAKNKKPREIIAIELGKECNKRRKN